MSSGTGSDSSVSSAASSGPSTPPSTFSDVNLSESVKTKAGSVGSDVEMPESLWSGPPTNKSSWPDHFPPVPVHVIPEGVAEVVGCLDVLAHVADRSH
jgi:hypothetical protein